ncbi:hypothetical protein [Bacillus sp. OK048]|uniref:hypothetical protein n=1 Tax=Bacillus sp. OK048 TaxID=1882761 RepID=UPI001C3173AA|nr:hypothetical protein [Bacillus sp. OK048]
MRMKDLFQSMMTWVKVFVLWYNYNYYYSEKKFFTSHKHQSGQVELVLRNCIKIGETAKFVIGSSNGKI